MIGKIISPSKIFFTCINYIFNGSKADQENFKKTGINKATLLCSSKCFGNVAELTTQFIEVSKLNPRLASPVQHMILSFSKEDIVTTNNMIEIVYKFSEKLGFDQHQFIAVKHNDKDHDHIHILTNRVSFEGKTFSNSNNYKKIAEFSREIEIAYGLKKVLSPRRFLPIEQRNIPRQDIRIDGITKIVIEAINKSSNYHQLKTLLLAAKIDLHLARGITFIDEQKVRLKGSKIGLSKHFIDDYFFKKNQSKLNNTITKELLSNKDNVNDIFRIVPNTKQISGLNDNRAKEKLVMEALKRVVNIALQTSNNLDELKYELLDKGINMEIGRGITFIDKNNIRIKGSEIGYSYQTLENYFENITVSKMPYSELEGNVMITSANQTDEESYLNEKNDTKEVNISFQEIHRLSNTVMLELKNQIAFRVGINKNLIKSIKISENNINLLKVLITNPPKKISRIDVIVKEVFEDIVLKYNLRTINILNNNYLSKLDDNSDQVETMHYKESIIEAMHESEDWFDLKNKLQFKGISFKKHGAKLEFIKNNLKISSDIIGLNIDNIEQFFKEKNNEKTNKPYRNKI